MYYGDYTIYAEEIPELTKVNISHYAIKGDEKLAQANLENSHCIKENQLKAPILEESSKDLDSQGKTGANLSNECIKSEN